MDNAVNTRWTGYDVASFREEERTEPTERYSSR
jgi:hypothetical protein